MIFFSTLEFLMLWIAIPDKTMTTVEEFLKSCQVAQYNILPPLPERLRF